MYFEIVIEIFKIKIVTLMQIVFLSPSDLCEWWDS